jgi:hypothetical protein
MEHWSVEFSRRVLVVEHGAREILDGARKALGSSYTGIFTLSHQQIIRISVK